MPKRDPPTADRRLHRFLAAVGITSIGDGIDHAAVPLLTASLTSDARLVAAVAMAQQLPWLVFSLVAGALVDRWDRRRVMVTADVARMVLVGALAVAVAAGVATVGLVAVTALLLGVADTFFRTASLPLVATLVEPAQLERANGYESSLEIVGAEFVGPPLGGLLFAVAAMLPLAIDAGSFGLSALLLASLGGSFAARSATAPAASSTAPASPATRAGGDGPSGERRGSAVGRLLSDVGEGLRWLRGHRPLRTLALVLGAWNFASSAGMSVFVLFARDRLGLDAQGYGLLLAGSAAGAAVAGSVIARVAGRVRRRRRHRRRRRVRLALARRVPLKRGRAAGDPSGTGPTNEPPPCAQAPSSSNSAAIVKPTIASTIGIWLRVATPAG